MDGLRIEIDLDQRDPPSGRVRAHEGDAVDFSGWLGLLRVLETLTTGGPARGRPPADEVHP